MKSCILVFSHIMPFEYRKHEYFRCPCKPTQNRNSVKLEFFSPLWNQESSGSFGITWSLRSLTGGLLNGCAKPSSQNSHVETSNQWVHARIKWFSMPKKCLLGPRLKFACSWCGTSNFKILRARLALWYFFCLKPYQFLWVWVWHIYQFLVWHWHGKSWPFVSCDFVCSNGRLADFRFNVP